MFSTAIAVLGAVALLSPGFLIVELSDARRARAKRSDLELTLRALVYSVLVHITFCWWTASLVSRVGEMSQVDEHLGAVVLYVVGVLFVVPVVVGVALSTYIARVEKTPGPPGLLAASLGAGQANDAFDFAFQQHHRGAWVIVELVGGSVDSPRYVGGVYGSCSAIGQTPSPHDIYLENVARIDLNDDGVPFIASVADPPQGLYLPAVQIARIDLFPNHDDADSATAGALGARVRGVFGALMAYTVGAWQGTVFFHERIETVGSGHVSENRQSTSGGGVERGQHAAHAAGPDQLCEG